MLTMSRAYQICNRCVLDTSDSEIVFDHNGICNHCHSYERLTRARLHSPPSGGEEMLQRVVRAIKAHGEGKEYDCLVGVSGGVDSTFVAYKAKELGLRPLAMHVDTGWDSELAVKNVERLLNILSLQLYTHVIDWTEMRDLQLAFFKSGVANCDTPSDHAIVASMYHVAEKMGIRYILTGWNLATEAVLPRSWGYNSADVKQLRAIQAHHGTLPLDRYPTLGFSRRFLWYRYVKRISLVRVLDYIDYNKKATMELLERDLGWKYYGGKHYESQFTKFFQAYYLPTRFGFDKRRAHLSNLICSGQLTRDEALAELQGPPCTEEEATELREYVAKKLGISGEEFLRIMNGPTRSYSDYANMEWLFALAAKVSAVVLKRPVV